MKTKVTKEQIEKCLNYFTEFKMLLESNKSFSVANLKEVHDMPININSAAKKTGILDIKGRGRNAKYHFKINTIEPIHARRIVEWISDENKRLIEMCRKDKVEKIDSPDLFSEQKPLYKRKRGISEKTIKKYTDYFNEIKLLIEYNAEFTPSTLARKHKISTGVMGCAVNTGLVKKLPYGKYKLTGPVNKETVKRVIDDVNYVTIKSKQKNEAPNETTPVVDDKELLPEAAVNKNGLSDSGVTELKSVIYKVFGIRVFEKIIK